MSRRQRVFFFLLLLLSRFAKADLHSPRLGPVAFFRYTRCLHDFSPSRHVCFQHPPLIPIVPPLDMTSPPQPRISSLLTEAAYMHFPLMNLFLFLSSLVRPKLKRSIFSSATSIPVSCLLVSCTVFM